jgi:hypothetical protein
VAMAVVRNTVAAARRWPASQYKRANLGRVGAWRAALCNAAKPRLQGV